MTDLTTLSYDRLNTLCVELFSNIRALEAIGSPIAARSPRDPQWLRYVGAKRLIRAQRRALKRVRLAAEVVA